MSKITIFYLHSWSCGDEAVFHLAHVEFREFHIPIIFHGMIYKWQNGCIPCYHGDPWNITMLLLIMIFTHHKCGPQMSGGGRTVNRMAMHDHDYFLNSLWPADSIDGISKCHYRFRIWLGACKAPSHYMKRCWIFVNWTQRNNFFHALLISKRTTKFFKMYLKMSSAR